MESFTDSTQSAPGPDPDPEGHQSVSEPDRVCILHVKSIKGKVQQQNVLPFTDSAWLKVRDAAERRRQKRNFHTSAYFVVTRNLPEHPSDQDGYHSACYKNFTAIPAETPSVTGSTPSTSPDTQLGPTTRSLTPTPSSSSVSTGIFPTSCLFCGKDRKRQKNGGVELCGKCETLEASQSIQHAAETLKDDIVFPKVIGVDLVAKEARYHHSCKSTFLMAAGRAADRAAKSQRSSDSDVSMDSSKDIRALSQICEYVEQYVIINQRPELLTSVYERYVDMCTATSETPKNTVFSLNRVLLRKFQPRIKIQTPVGTKLGNIIYSSDMSENAVRNAYDYTSTDERIVTKAALLMRKQLLGVEKACFPEGATLDDLKDGDSSPPELVVHFFKVLYCGPTSSKYSDSVKCRAESASQDALFIVQRGKAMPAKHVALGMSVKSVTGSKKMVQVLNRFGHCLNYNKLEELETSTAEKIQERQLSCPDGTVVGSPMGLAFDNFDELTQTLSGADSLHDTMGICYQNAQNAESTPCEGASCTIDGADKGKAPIVSKDPVPKKSSRKRTLDTSSDAQIAPYRKVPKMTSFMYRNTDISSISDTSYTKAKQLDLMWMMGHAIGNDVLPMWVGFNASFSSDPLPRQDVRYMPNMQQPITSLDVVQHTLVTTQRCAEECKQPYGIVTYDLNAAKPAWQIQTTESPRFNNIFIMPGAFHIEMAFFKAVGKLITESGGPEMLTESGVLASGSLNGFITGKHFNRCKRLHPILALSLEKLHFQKFLDSCERKDDIENWMSCYSLGQKGEVEVATNSDEFIAFTTLYEEYSNGTRKGMHGATAQFWSMYIDYIQTYHAFERAIRTNDIDLYTQTLTPIIGLFFAANHVNYCRWLTKFQLDLLNVEHSHPGLREILESGVFSIRRTDHPFSRCPVDLTLEQTINADAASRLTGVTAFTNNFAARLRWMVTKSTRATFISIIQEMAGIVQKDDTAELKPSRVRRDNIDLNKVINQIESSCNPFEGKAEEMLYNIHTGKAVGDEVRQSLLEVPETGKTLHQQFIQECEADAGRFERPIKRAPLKTFVESGARNKKAKDRKVAVLKCTRDLMGRLVMLAAKRELDLAHIFTYPLTPVPLTMCHPDEMMVKTNKNSLLHLLEGKQEEVAIRQPNQIAACIIDGQYLLRILPPSINIPPTYGGLARTILTQALGATKTHRVHIAFDDYPELSLKDAERARRGATVEENRSYAITGPAQRRPKDLDKALDSRSFKLELPNFLSREWQDPSYSQILGPCDVILDLPSGDCLHYSATTDGKVQCEHIPDLISNHEEADTKIIRHVIDADNATQVGEVIVRAHDTDIAVILIYHCHKIRKNVWMDVGTVAKKTRRLIDITAIQRSLGPEMSNSLPGFHAYTGCDYTSAFVKRGKVRPFTKLQRNKEVQKAFHVLTQDPKDEKCHKVLLKYTASMYGAKENSTISLNTHRYKCFERVYKPKIRGRNPLEKLKGIDASALPPCESEVISHLKRVAFVAQMWANADQHIIDQHPSEDDGWAIENGVYQPIWFEGPQLPETLLPGENEVHSAGEDETAENIDASSDEEGDTSWDEDDVVEVQGTNEEGQYIPV